MGQPQADKTPDIGPLYSELANAVAAYRAIFYLPDTIRTRTRIRIRITARTRITTMIMRKSRVRRIEDPQDRGTWIEGGRGHVGCRTLLLGIIYVEGMCRFMFIVLLSIVYALCVGVYVLSRGGEGRGILSVPHTHVHFRSLLNSAILI